MNLRCLSKMRKVLKTHGGLSASSKAFKSTRTSMSLMKLAAPLRPIQLLAMEVCFQQKKTWQSWQMIFSAQTLTQGETLLKPC